MLSDTNFWKKLDGGWKSRYYRHSKLNKWVEAILKNRTGGHAQSKNEDIHFKGMKCQIPNFEEVSQHMDKGELVDTFLKAQEYCIL